MPTRGLLEGDWGEDPARWVGWYDFDGEAAPVRLRERGRHLQSSFSVGVFQWVHKAGGRGVKRGPVLVRVHGLVDQEREVYRLAAQICFQLDAGTYDGTKKVTVPR